MSLPDSIIPSDLRVKFEFHNFGHALEILPQACAEEWEDLLAALRSLSIPLSEIVEAGGNESAIPKRFDDMDGQAPLPAALKAKRRMPHSRHRNPKTLRQRRNDMSDLNATITDLRSFADGRTFKTIYADPPWQFQNRTGKVAPEHRRLTRYETMPIDDIKSLPVGDLADAKSHLYLWVPNALLPSAHSAEQLLLAMEEGPRYNAESREQKPRTRRKKQ